MRKPRLLYLSPVLPARTGLGLAMRAGMMLEALASDHAVHLLVIPVLGGGDARHLDPAVRGWCSEVAVHRTVDHLDPLFSLISRLKDPVERLAAQTAYPRPALCRFATTRSIHEAAGAFGGVSFPVIHVFRLYLAPFAEPYLRGDPAGRRVCRLDLDDHESRTRHRIAALHEARGDPGSATRERAEAEKYAAMEARELPRFERVYVCSDLDRQEVERQHGARNLAVVPNAVRVDDGATAPESGAPFTFLFVGTLGYYPNEDAALFLCEDILPRLRAIAPGRFRVWIVGAHPSPRVRNLSAHPEVTVRGTVPALAPYYRDAHAVVVPLRAGGGTRIKVLEAFAHRRPVVSTSLGVEGIRVSDREHVLVGDTPADFAERCRLLMHDRRLGGALAERAFAFVQSRHSPERVRAALREADGAAHPGGGQKSTP